MGWRLANATGRWLLSATTGLWKLCTCCTGGCANVYLVYSCQPHSAENPCRFGDERYYICEDATFDDGSGNPRTIADIYAAGDVLTSLGEGCFYLADYLPYADIPAGVSEYPYISDSISEVGVDCDDAPCAPDYTGTCNCVCYTNDEAGDSVCCYGQKNASGAIPRYELDLTASLVVTVENTFGGGTASVPCPDDCASGTDCTLISDQCETYGTERADDLGAQCQSVKNTRARTVTSKSCCTDTNAPVEWFDVGTSGAEMTGFSTGFNATTSCGYSCFGGVGNVSGETIYSTVGSCVNKIAWSNTLSQTCTSRTVECHAEEWTAYARFDDADACHCQRVQITDVSIAWTLTPVSPQTADEARLCAMCDLSN